VEFQDPSGCTDVKHILVEDCLFWNAEFGNTLEIGYETRNDYHALRSSQIFLQIFCFRTF